MIKWLVVIVLLAFVAAPLDAYLRRILPRGLPGDVRIRLGGRERLVPLGMTVLLSALASLVLYRL